MKALYVIKEPLSDKVRFKKESLLNLFCLTRKKVLKFFDCSVPCYNTAGLKVDVVAYSKNQRLLALKRMVMIWKTGIVIFNRINN